MVFLVPVQEHGADVPDDHRAVDHEEQAVAEEPIDLAEEDDPD